MQFRHYVQIILMVLWTWGLICQGGERQTIRIGFYAYSGYHDQDAYGRRSGYGYDVLQGLRAYTNWCYEYVGYEKRLEDMEELLRRGEIDLVTGVFKTAELEAEFAFSKNPLGISQMHLVVKPGNDRYLQQDYSHWRGMRIGMVRGTVSNEDFRQFARQKRIVYKEYLYETTAALAQAFTRGEIEAVAYYSMNHAWNEWSYETIQSRPVYAMTRQNSKDLLKQFDDGLAALKMDNPDLFAGLPVSRKRGDEFTQETVITNPDYLPLTVREREYVSAAKDEGREFTVLISPDHAPFSVLGKDGQMSGFIVEVAKLLAMRTGLRLTVLPVNNCTEYWRLRKERQADLIFDFINDTNESERLGYVLSQSYYRTALARIKRSIAEGEIKSVAVLGKSDMENIVCGYLQKQGIKDEAIALYDSNAAVYEAVGKGYQDAGYLFSQIAHYFMYLHRDKSIIVESLPQLEKEFAIAFRDDLDGEAMRVFMKGLQSISSHEIRNMVLNNALDEQLPMTLKDILHEYPYVGIGMASLLVILIGSILGGLLRTHLRTVVQHREKRYREELGVARQNAEVANRAKNIFLFNMSHDIRTPINVIIGFTDMAMKYLNDKEHVADCLKKISNASHHLMSLLNDVLDMAQVESGKVVLRDDDLNIRDVCNSLASMIETDAAKKQVTFFMDYGRLVKEDVYGDGLRINQVMLNILTNAVTYTPPGGTVQFRIEQMVSRRLGYGLYRFVVKDTGVGMSKEFQEQIFDMFTRDELGVRRGEHGIGLGMALTKKLVDLMDGDITLESEPAKGTTVTVQLELMLRQIVPVLDATEKESPMQAKSDLSGMTELVVEDNKLELSQ